MLWRPVLGLMICSGVGSVGLIRGLDSEIGFGPRKTLESMCTWLCGRLAVIKEPWCPAVFVWTRLEPSAAVAATCGPVRRLAVEIGFGPVSGPWPVWRLAGHGPRTAGFRRFRIDTDCVRLPDCLFWWTDSGIGPRNRIRAEENTGIDVCPTVRLIGDNRRTLVFRRFRMGAVCVRCRTACFRGLIRESDIEIGFGTRGTLESVCALLHGRPILIDEPRDSAGSGCVRAAIVCRRRRCLGLVRRLDLEIGFGSASEP